MSQDDTLVLKEHRGHRLGMLLKVANLEFLQRERPGHPAVTTFNAAENEHMLAVNDALGFVPVRVGGGVEAGDAAVSHESLRTRRCR